MKLPSRRPAISVTLVVILAAIVAVLALLEIRWTGQVSEANRERMQAALQANVLRFRRDFHLQLLRICWAFESPANGFSERTLRFYSGRYDDWMSASARPNIIAGLYVWNGSNRLVELNPISGRFEPARWSANLNLLRNDSARKRNAGSAQTDSKHWLLLENEHVLFHPFRPGASPGETVANRGGVIIDLNMSFIWHTLMPELVNRYFGGPSGDYRVSVVGNGKPSTVYYRSAALPSDGGALTGDVVESLTPAYRSGWNGGAESNEAASPAREHADFLPLMAVVPGSQAWRLVVRHREGSVAAAVTSLRRRDLALSLGVLLLLAASIALIVVYAQRVDRLARLQLDFVTGVSHEIRTPLAVIGSAAENLADGVVSSPEQVHRYGALIRSQTRQLGRMVNQVLDFSSSRHGQQAYSLHPVEIGALIDTAMAGIGPAIENGKIEIEKHIEPGLPPVLADAEALQRCVLNLISNASKYGGESRWVGIRATFARDGDEIRLSIADHGAGIEPADLPHIFEPFYRGKRDGSPIHGTGLGLAIADDIAKAMGGRLSVASQPGRGSCFTIHLPAMHVANAPIETASS